MEELTQDQIKAILNNLAQVLSNPEGLCTVAKAYIAKQITLEMLQETGQLTPQLRTKLDETIKSQRVEYENELWRKAMASQELSDFEKYVSECPQGMNVSLAQTIIAGKIAQRNQLSQKGLLINKLKENINAYRSGALIEKGISLEDLIQNGLILPQEIQDIYSNSCVQLSLGTAPTSIPEGRTEVYFWGVPGSGKTCTLAAILKTAKIVEDAEMQGDCLKYFQRLANIFNNGVGTLPPGTEKEKYQTYSFDLLDSDSSHYPMTFIDLPGELFSDFTKARQDINFVNAKQSFADFRSLITDTKNPKYHFFIIDVGNDDIDVETGLTQEQLLSNAATYFKANEIFNEQTAGMAILVTKSDLLSRDDDECYQKAKALLEKKYNNFILTLKSIAKERRLIRSEQDPLELIPFSIGEVYLQDKCVFDPTKSQEVVKYLIEHIAIKKKKSGWSLFNE